MEQVAQCQSPAISPNTLYWTRSLLSTRPFGMLFGDWPKGLDVYNAALQSASLALLFWLIRRAHGPAAAAVGVLVWGVFPERVFAVTLATPDNAAALVVIGLLALSSASPPATRRRAALGVGLLALGLFAVELLRSARALFALAALVVPLAAADGRRFRRAGLALVGVVGFSLCSGALHATLPRLDEARSFPALLASTDLSSDQTFAVVWRWTEHLWRAIPVEQRTGVALRAFETELSGNAAMYPGYVRRKAASLFRGDGYAFFATADVRSHAGTEPTVPRSTVPAFPPGELPSRTVLAGLSTLAVAGLLRMRKDSLTLAATAVLAVVLGVVLLLGEAQPRYLLLPGPAVAVLAAASWSTTPAEARPVRALLPGLLAVFACVLLFAAWAAVWGYGSSRRFCPSRVSRRTAGARSRARCCSPACDGHS